MSPRRRSGVTLYAEFLLNISQVTIYATLDLTGKTSPTAHLSSDRRRIAITYGGERAAITYPNGVSGTAVVHLPVEAAADVSLRLEITEKGEAYWRKALETLEVSPWTARAFSRSTVVACAGCRRVFCGEEGGVRAWKDLPRGDWAETMDLWHCHKPSEDGVKGGSSGERVGGFEKAAAAAAVGPEAGVGFIDSANLILALSDTRNLKATGYAGMGLIQLSKNDSLK